MAPDLSFTSSPSTPRRTRPITRPPPCKSTNPVVVDLAINSSATRLATAHSDGTLNLWKPSHGADWTLQTTVRTKHEPSELRIVRFAPPRMAPGLLVTVGGDGLAVVYRVSEVSGDVFVRETLIQDARMGLVDADFGENGVLGTVGKEGVLRVYEMRGKGDGWGLSAEVDVGVGGGVSFAPGGRYCVVGGVVLMKESMGWDWVPCTMVDKEREVVCVDWGRGGWIGVGRENGGVEVWQMKEGKLRSVARMEGVGMVGKVEWDQAGGVLASAHEDGKVRTWARMPGEGLGDWSWALKDCVEVGEGEP